MRWLALAALASACHGVSLIPGGDGGGFADDLGPGDGVGEPVTSIAQGQQDVVALAAVGGEIVWTTIGSAGGSGTLASCSTSGGCGFTPTVLATPRAGTSPLAADATHVYWGDFHDVMTCTLAGCTPASLATDVRFPAAIAVDGSAAYWASNEPSSDDAGLASCAIGGCGGSGAPVVDATTTVYAIAIDATSIYWSTFDAIRRCPLAGCGSAVPDTVATDTEIRSIAVSGGELWWVDAEGAPAGAVRTCALPDCATTTTVASGEAAPLSIAVDDSGVYYTVFSTGEVRACPRAAAPCTPAILAAGRGAVSAIALDADSVYFAGATDVGKVAKPE